MLPSDESQNEGIYQSWQTTKNAYLWFWVGDNHFLISFETGRLISVGVGVVNGSRSCLVVVTLNEPHYDWLRTS